ncbi:MAG: Pilus assembly protein PilW [Massilia sp.]|nr:Pilus assembly protein PilW [Massilia sp.]
MIARRQHGASIAELMVAIAIGMAVMLMAAGLLTSANAAYQAQAEAAALDDRGRYALEIITRAVRQAAFVDWEREAAGPDGAAPSHIGGLDARTLSRAADGISEPLPGAVNGSDVLAVRYAGSGTADGGDGSAVNCAGFGVGAHEDGWSIFYVGRSSLGEDELRCKYRGKTSWGADAVVGGVDSFQVLYGLDTDDPADGVANQYVSAAVLEALDGALVLIGATPEARDRERSRRTHWKRVAGVRVALLLHGAAVSRKDGEPAVFDLFGRAYSDGAGAGDTGVRLDEARMPGEMQRRQRRMFATTVLLRNPPGETR